MNERASEPLTGPIPLSRKDIFRWLALLGLSIPVYATITLSPILNGAAMERLNADSFAIGTARTAEVLINASITIALAPRLSRFDAKSLGLTGAALMAAGALASAFAQTYPALFAARILAGLGGGLVQCAAAVFMAETRSPQRVGGSLMVPITLCAVAAALAGGRLADSMGAFGVFAVLAAACGAGFVLACGAPPLSPPDARPKAAASSRTSVGALRSPYVLAAAIAFIGSTASWNFFERKGHSLGLTKTDISNLIAAASLGAGLLGSLSILIKDRWLHRAGLVALTIFALCAALVPAAPDAAILAAAYALQTAAYAFCANLLTSIGVKLDSSGGLAAAGRGWSTLLNAGAPALGGALILAGGFTPLSYLCLAAGFGSVFFLHRAQRIARF